MTAHPDLPAVLAGDERFATLADIWSARLAAIDPQEVLVRWIDRVDTSLLPVLAEEYSLLDDGWELAETEEAQRALLKGAIRLHRIKGTPAAIREVFRALSLGEIEIDEGTNGYCYDGSVAFDGFASYDDPAGWAEYRVRIDKLLSVRQADAVRRLLDSVAPARSLLWGIDFTNAELLYNDMAAFDGSYTYGVA
nr:phage tail protein [uncultured Pseudogulbenkiania sp.]